MALKKIGIESIEFSGSTKSINQKDVDQLAKQILDGEGVYGTLFVYKIHEGKYKLASSQFDGLLYKALIEVQKESNALAQAQCFVITEKELDVALAQREIIYATESASIPSGLTDPQKRLYKALRGGKSAFPNEKGTRCKVGEKMFDGRTLNVLKRKKLVKEVKSGKNKGYKLK